MAILSKIRQRSILLILIIALALFSFVLADVIKSGGFSGNSNKVGSINGTDIDYQEFMQKVSNAEKQQQGMTTTQAINNVWEQEVRKVLLNEQYDKIGLTLGKDQIMGVIKNHPQYSQAPQFLNAAGKFDEKKFEEYVKTLQNSQDQAAWQQWLAFETDIQDYAKEQIYNTLIKSSVYTTKVEGKVKYERETNKVDFDFVSVAYSTVSDDQVKVSDEEIIAYMKKNPKKYKYDNTRTLEFVVIDNKPSKEDEQAIKTKIDGLLKGGVVYNTKTGKNDTLSGFGGAKNIAEFVNANSDLKFDSTYVAKKDLSPEFGEQLFNLAPGQVYGPYIEGGYYKLTRLVGRKGNANAKVSHILVAYKGASSAAPTVKLTKEEAKAKANSLLAQVPANPGNFAMLAMINSDDQGSKQNGGVYDNVVPGQMVKPFNDFLFNNPVGKMAVVETDFGFHVMRVEAKYDAVSLGTVALKIQPSEKTENANYDKANKFEAEATTSGIEKAAKTSGLKVAPSASVRAYDENINGLGVQRQIVSWAFNDDTKEGNVKRFDIPNVGFAVVSLKAKNDNGLLPLDIAKQSVEPLIKNEKKAEIIRKKMNGTSLDAIAKSTGATITPAIALSLGNPVLPNIGFEPKVVGTAIGLAPNKTSKLIDGNMGVYMVRTKLFVKAPSVKDYNTQIDQLSQQSKGGAPYRVIQALRDRAKIDDNRGRF